MGLWVEDVYLIVLWLSWGLWGLYACIVRRLEVRKRKPAYFIGFTGFIGCFALVLCWLVLLFLLCCCLGCFAPVVCVGCVFFVGLCCWWFFFPSDDMTIRKGAPCWRVLSLFVGCFIWLLLCIPRTRRGSAR